MKEMEMLKLTLALDQRFEKDRSLTRKARDTLEAELMNKYGFKVKRANEIINAFIESGRLKVKITNVIYQCQACDTITKAPSNSPRPKVCSACLRRKMKEIGEDDR